MRSHLTLPKLLHNLYSIIQAPPHHQTGRRPHNLVMVFPTIIQSDVACVLYRETVGASRYADRRFITGTLQDLIDGAELFLSRDIAVGAKVEGFKRIDIPEYSLEALREAVINAVVHRDYSKRGESIRVFCYPNRVEIHSPGLLLPGITVEQMERGKCNRSYAIACLQIYSKIFPATWSVWGVVLNLCLTRQNAWSFPGRSFERWVNLW